VTNIKRRTFFIIFQFILIILIVFIILISPINIINKIVEFRKGSSEFRVKLYKTTLSQAIQHPILGYGFKPRPEEFPVPIGSHSMYFGVIYKTGFLGLFVFIAFWLSVLKKWWRQKNILKGDKIVWPLWYYSGVALIGGLLWMFTEDLDAPPIVAFLYFLIVGFIISLDKLKKSEAVK